MLVVVWVVDAALLVPTTGAVGSIRVVVDAGGGRGRLPHDDEIGLGERVEKCGSTSGSVLQDEKLAKLLLEQRAWQSLLC